MKEEIITIGTDKILSKMVIRRFTSVLVMENTIITEEPDQMENLSTEMMLSSKETGPDQKAREEQTVV